MLTREKKLNISFSMMVKDDFYLVFCTTSTDKGRLPVKNDGHNFEDTEPLTNKITSLSDISTNFKLGEIVHARGQKLKKIVLEKLLRFLRLAIRTTNYLSYYRFLNWI